MPTNFLRVFDHFLGLALKGLKLLLQIICLKRKVLLHVGPIVNLNFEKASPEAW